MRKLGLPRNVISFVLPTGITINMNGTSCYHAIATVFVAQVMGVDLSLAQMLSIVVLTTVSSIGTPGIPSGGMAILMLVLVAVGIPAEGIAMIIAMDRPLDMLITAVNVSPPPKIPIDIFYHKQRGFSTFMHGFSDTFCRFLTGKSRATSDFSLFLRTQA